MSTTLENKPSQGGDRQAAATENGTTRKSPPRRRKNAEVRAREHLTESEIDQLRKHASFRDSAMILIAYRHALRVGELVALEWRDVQSLDQEARASIMIRRLKGSIDGTHPLEPDEVKALRRLRKESPDAVYIFENSHGGGKLTEAAFRKTLTRIAHKAGLSELRPHPHGLRHSAGVLLVDRMPLGMLADFMGHAQIQNTRIYSRANGERFRGIWRRTK
jgi:type 1 fimbriae regulatory protein FimB/type 1 fimbriae regulatory protein FimE